MKLDSLTSAVSRRTRYLALVLPLFALFSTVHGGCIRGPAGYGTYGNYGYGNRASALEGDGTASEEGACVVYAGYGDHASRGYGSCDEGDTVDGYDGEWEHDDHGSP